MIKEVLKVMDTKDAPAGSAYVQRPVTRDEKRAELKLEIEWRHRVYRKMVNERRMTNAVASRKIRIMNAILADYDDEPKLL